jgi:hypothetical protein
MNKREQIIEELCDDETLMFADGFDEAIIGVTYNTESRVVYSFTKAVEILRKEMSEEEAIEHLHYNVMINGSEYPIWVMDYYG